MQRDVLLLHEMIDAAEQARQLVASYSVPDLLLLVGVVAKGCFAGLFPMGPFGPVILQLIGAEPGARRLLVRNFARR
jgi:hypothetical protein